MGSRYEENNRWFTIILGGKCALFSVPRTVTFSTHADTFKYVLGRGLPSSGKLAESRDIALQAWQAKSAIFWVLLYIFNNSIRNPLKPLWYSEKQHKKSHFQSNFQASRK